MAREPKRRLLGFAVNLLVFAGSVATFFLVCELFVWRFVWPASDVPVNHMPEGIIRYAPHQHGTWRVRNEIAAPFRINAQGWNSAKVDYPTSPRAGVARIALIGDSYVEAFQVPFDRSAGERIEAALGADKVEVFRYGISGAPLSQYLRMLEWAALPAQPAIAVIMVVHNDFEESHRFVPGRYTSAFLKLALEDDRVVREVQPQEYRAGRWDWLRRTTTAGFFYYRWGVRPSGLARAVFGGGKSDAEANIAVDDLSGGLRRERAVAEHVFRRLAALGREANTSVLIVMDGNRSRIYSGADPYAGAGALNRMAAEAARRHGLEFLDLTEIFAAEYRRAQRRFEFAADGHWNEYGHEVVATAVAARLRPLLDARASRR